MALDLRLVGGILDRLGAPRARRTAWTVVCVYAVTIFLAIALSGRPPALDLPQHALLLGYLQNGHPQQAYRLYASSPYTLYFGVIRLLMLVMSPVRAAWVATALSLALVPLGSAYLAERLGKTPLFGLLAAIATFDICTAYGFTALHYGAAALPFALGSTVQYATRGRVRDGVVVVVALVLTYAAHFVAWAVALPAAGLLYVAYVGRRALRLRPLWPFAGGALITFAAFAHWMSEFVVTEGMKVEATYHWPGPSVSQRLWSLPDTAAGYGRIGALHLAWWPLAAVLVLGFVVTLVGAVRRARRWASARRVPWRALPSRLALPLVMAGCLYFYFTGPLMEAGTFFIFPRFVLLAAVLLPAVLPRHPRAAGLIGALAVIPAFGIAELARRETAHYARATSCVDELARSARPGEAFASIACTSQPPDYHAPLRMYAGVEIAAERGGVMGWDFADFGLVVSYAPGWGRTFLPSKDRLPQFYDHARQGGEFTAWVFIGCDRKAVAEVFTPAERYPSTTCGDLTLVHDATVLPDSKPHEKYLPHPLPGPGESHP